MSRAEFVAWCLLFFALYVGAAAAVAFFVLDGVL